VAWRPGRPEVQSGRQKRLDFDLRATLQIFRHGFELAPEILLTGFCCIGSHLGGQGPHLQNIFRCAIRHQWANALSRDRLLWFRHHPIGNHPLATDVACSNKTIRLPLDLTYTPAAKR